MIRVLRIMEYDFPTSEAAEASMAHWAVPPNGVKVFGTNSKIRSAMIIDLTPTHQTLSEEEQT